MQAVSQADWHLQRLACKKELIVAKVLLAQDALPCCFWQHGCHEARLLSFCGLAQSGLKRLIGQSLHTVPVSSRWQGALFWRPADHPSPAYGGTAQRVSAMW